MPYPQPLLQQYQVLQDPNDTLHRTVSDLVASYNSPWDPLTELIQNAVDAINLRATEEGAGFSGRIRITINAPLHEFTVEDNGIGMAPDRHETLLLPGGSEKSQGNTYGHKGLGFTYCAHVADRIVVDTTDSSGAHSQWEFAGGFAWLNDAASTPSFDRIQGPTIRRETGPGTAVRTRLAVGEYERNVANTAGLDRFFEWANDAKLLPFVLRTRTAIGQVGHLFNQQPPTGITVEVVYGDSDPQSIPFQFFDFSQYAPFSSQNYPKAIEYYQEIFTNTAVPNKTHYGIHHVFVTDQGNQQEPLKVGSHKGGVRFAAYIYACGRDNLREALSQYDARLSANFRYLSFATDVHLAIDGMPCGVPIDGWNNYGAHEQRYFAIVNTELSFGTVLDAGRKTITRYYVDLLVDKLVTMAKDAREFGGTASFHDMSVHLHTTSALPPQRTVPAYIARWRGYQDLPTNALLLKKLPDDELGVYLLFGEIVGRGLLPGYSMLYVSGGAVYDSALEFAIDLTAADHRNPTAGGTCRMGVGTGVVQQYGGSGPRYSWSDAASGVSHLVTEFKVRAEDLLRDIRTRRTQKEVRHISVLVCLSYDEAEVRRLQGALVPVNDAARPLSGVTHRLLYGGHEIQVIPLLEVIEHLTQAGEL